MTVLVSTIIHVMNNYQVNLVFEGMAANEILI